MRGSFQLNPTFLVVLSEPSQEVYCVTTQTNVIGSTGKQPPMGGDEDDPVLITLRANLGRRALPPAQKEQLSPPHPDSSGAPIKRAGGRGRTSAAFNWLWQRRTRVIKIFDDFGGPDWEQVARALSAHGYRDAEQKPLTARSIRQTWRRVSAKAAGRPRQDILCAPGPGLRPTIVDRVPADPGSPVGAPLGQTFEIIHNRAAPDAGQRDRTSALQEYMRTQKRPAEPALPPLTWERQ